MNESMKKIVAFYDIKEQQELKKELYVPWIFRSKILYFLPYLVAGWYYAHMMNTAMGTSILWFIWGLIGYVVFFYYFLILENPSFVSWEISGKEVFNVGHYPFLIMTMLTINRLIEKFVFLTALHIMLVVVVIINYVIWKIAFGYGILVLSGYKRRDEEINQINEKISQDNWENKKKKENVESLIIIQNMQSIQYIADAIDLYNEENYEDAVANIRRALESYLYQRMETEGIIFNDKMELNTFNMIKKLQYSKSELNYIRKSCNSCVHTLENDTFIGREQAKYLINTMLVQLISYSEVADRNTNIVEEINKNLETYFERAKTHERRKNEKDSLLNMRKSLECIVRGYMKFNHIICAYGHDKNLNGYIDMLFEQEIISAKSKKAMHEIRMASNKGVHVEKSQTKQPDLHSIIVLLEKEIEIYLESQRKENPEDVVNRMVEYEGDEELDDDDDYYYDDYDEDYDDDDEDDYDEDDYEDDYDYDNYWNENAYGEDDDYDEDEYNPKLYYDVSRRYNPEIRNDINEYYNPFGLNSDDEDY